MAQILNVTEDGTVVLDKVALKYTSGSVIHSGFLQIVGNTQIDSNLVVRGTVTADVFNVKNLITENGSLASVGQWAYATEPELNGKGFSWTHGTGSTQMLYRSGNRLWTNADFDLSEGRTYSINNIPVISLTSLGDTITESNLTSLGTLETLEVSGNSVFGEFIFVDSISNRLGIGTDEPNASLTILDNNVEIGIGSPQVGLATIGTYSSHDLAIVSDNLARITVKATGDVNIGDPVHGGGKLNVYGTLYATTVQTDNRIDRVHPLQFQATDDTSIYGLGLTWQGTGATRQFIMSPNPDRLFSTESIDLGPNQAYYVNGKVAVNADGLGDTILNSSLQSLGVLRELSVAGASNFNHVTAQQLSLSSTETSGNTNIDPSGISSNSVFNVTVSSQKIVSADTNQIAIGDSRIQSKPVKVFGPLSVNINNPDPNLQFAVNGDVSIGGKRFTNGVAAPTHGSFQIGDICWNTAPSPTGYVGWICIVAGTPGTWASFGMIAAQ
jgi:hypothetical protein